MGDRKMKCTLTLFIAVILLQYTAFAADKPPQSVAEIWSDFDPRVEPLEVVVR